MVKFFTKLEMQRYVVLLTFVRELCVGSNERTPAASGAPAMWCGEDDTFRLEDPFQISASSRLVLHLQQSVPVSPLGLLYCCTEARFGSTKQTKSSSPAPAVVNESFLSLHDLFRSLPRKKLSNGQLFRNFEESIPRVVATFPI